MIPKTRMITAYCLALALVVLPFSTSFGFFMSNFNSSMDMDLGHTESVECGNKTATPTCLQLSDQEQHADTDDECCSDHCDSFSGAQICTDKILETDIPFTDEYLATTTPRISDLIPSQILRPPLFVS